jgi:hypothetical protein
MGLEKECLRQMEEMYFRTEDQKVEVKFQFLANQDIKNK